MILINNEEAPTTFEPQTSAEQMNGHVMSGAETREAEGPGSSTTSPSEGRHADGTSGSSVLDMSSTDSAGNAHSGGPSCGLVSSLFPSSCRGRAEAFARSLHRRLTSLGGDDNAQNKDTQTSQPKETTWLHAPTGTKTAALNNSNSTNHVHQRQPRHSSESDLYYDFDIDLEDGGPSSPEEEATPAELADLLVNPGVLKNNHHDSCHYSSNGPTTVSGINDPESGCIFASPITGTSPDSDVPEMYFDPESSEAEKSKNEVYFDPITSESETTSNLSNGCAAPIKRTSLPCRRRLDKALDASEDTSESSLSSRENNHYDRNCRQSDIVCSSEESTNGKSSQGSTSPSHESLWSTFDDSTVSLQDDCPSNINSTVTPLQSRFPKSYSDSEIPVNGSIASTSSGLARDLNNDDDDDDDEGIDEVDFVNGVAQNDKLNIDKVILVHIAKENSPDSSDDNTVEDLPSDEVELERDKTYDSNNLGKNLLDLQVSEAVSVEGDNDHSTYSSTINIPGALTLECPTGERVIEASLKNEIQLQIENGTVVNGTDEDKMCLLLKKLATSPTVKEDVHTPVQDLQEDDVEEEGEEEERPQKVRRCSSLKTGKTPPGTPGRKKIVRFADVLGLDLADVRTFLDEIPKIPNSAYSDLMYDDIFQKDSSPVNSLPNNWGTRYLDSRRGSGNTVTRKLDRTLVPLFQQPGGLPNFLDLVRERRVCLENVLVEDPLSLSIQGTVRVLNLDFHKSVHIRYTLNSWRNFSDLQATYVPNSCDGFSDKFSFILYCHTLTVGQRLEFAVRFQCKGVQYWDNNAGANYCFQCLPTASTVGYIPITAQETPRHEWSPMFY